MVIIANYSFTFNYNYNCSTKSRCRIYINKEFNSNSLNNRIKKLQRETQVVEGKNVVYLATSEESEKDGIYTVGKAINLKNRLQAYNDNKLHNFKIVKYISCKSIQLMDAIEKIILSKLFNIS